MLTVKIQNQELFDEATQQFVDGEGVTLDLEHSLVSVSKWESMYGIPFLSDRTELTGVRLFDYLKCMVVTPGVDPNVLVYADASEMQRIQEYIASSQSATTFRPTPQGQQSREQITSELIYYWMDVYGIQQEAENWHLGRLFARIRIHSVKNEKPKKRSTEEIAAERRLLNEQRRKEFNSNG